jgi:hypothetical protein
MRSYPNSAEEWKRRKEARMHVRDWIVVTLVMTTIFALAWLAGGWVRP